MDPRLLNPGFKQTFKISMPQTDQECADLWAQLGAADEWTTYTSKWSRDELGAVYGEIPWLPDTTRTDFPAVYVGTPVPAGTRGYRGASSNVVLHDLRDRMALSLFSTHVRNHMPGDDRDLNLASASALANLVKEFGYEVDPSLFVGSPDQAPRVTTTIFDSLACAVAATASPHLTTRVPERLFHLLDERSGYLPFALGLAQMWRRTNPISRRGQVFSRPRTCIWGDLFMAAHETAHMFARGALPARADHLRALAFDISSSDVGGVMGQCMQGARRVISDDHKWAALVGEISADHVAHLLLQSVDDSPERALTSMAYQGAVAWMSGCRAIGSMTYTLDRFDQVFERWGASLLRFDMASLSWRNHLETEELALFNAYAPEVCTRSWAEVGKLWARGLTPVDEKPQDQQMRNGRALSDWGQRTINSIWDSWWSPMSRASMVRLGEGEGNDMFDFLDL